MSATSGVRAALYLRQSLDATGEQLAVQRQRSSCQRIAEQRGWQIVAEYVDNSISASDARKQRPGYEALVQAYEAGAFDAVLCWDLDRLTRQPRQLEDWVDRSTERGLLLVTANGEADLGTDGGRMFARIKAAVARGEVERKAARQRAAAAQRAEHGRPPLGPRLTGYTSSGDSVAHEAETVRTLFDRFSRGDSLRALAAWLTETGIPTRRGAQRWSPSSVRTILTNPRYAGRAVYDGQETGSPGAWEALVTDDVFTVVQHRLNDPRRATNRVGTDRRHLGSGLYRCGRCDQPVRAWSGGRYRCPEACVNRSGERVDDYVLRVIRARLGRADVADLAEHLAPAGDGQRHRDLIDEAGRLRKRLAVIGNDYDAGLIDGQRFKLATEKARAELTATEARLAAISAVPAAAALFTAGDPVAAFEEAPLMLKRGAIDVLCTVRLHPAPRGRKAFDPDTVTIDWVKEVERWAE